jgi:hypothetical protein
MADRDRENKPTGSTGQDSRPGQGQGSGAARGVPELREPDPSGGRSTQGRGNPDRDDKGQFTEGGNPGSGSRNAGRGGSGSDIEEEERDEA